ncbi:XdhC family protein [Streptomyces virginiae]|uniref:XdhC family protein n=1 Tax=Streptomyces virginiae TaxID=1961 RepID=UPI002DB78612|nr:XdhC family protein [Streptomyces sp. CMAA1738]MEC4572831.1 XdhC family protein [Streptomyces sp. CMAA1738]
MLDIAEELRAWCAARREFALATVVAVSGSAPRGPGASLAVDDRGTALGSISGGCVESAVHELCLDAIASGRGGLHRFGYSDDDAFAVGLTCGGVLDVLVTPVRGRDPVRPVLGSVLDAAADGTRAALARVVSGPPRQLGRALAVHADGSYEGGLAGGPALDRAAAGRARALLLAGRTGTAELGTAGGLCGEPLTLLVESAAEPPRLIVYGAIDFAAALARIGAFLGHRVTVCDARPVFATPARFPEADEVVVDWPHRHLAAQWEAGRLDSRTAVCVLTHDAKFDVPLLELALRLPLGYVGAMGSRRTHAERVRRLREEGVTDAALARLRSPIGLDLGGATPEETALAIAAEFTAFRHGGSALPLTGGAAPIHRRPAAASAPRPTAALSPPRP